MRFESLSISNFKAIATLQLHGLADMIVVAGPNGCGKSAVLDAIRTIEVSVWRLPIERDQQLVR